MRMTFVSLLALLAVSPALASEPGKPLDCADWVITEPGIECSIVVAHPCAGLCLGGSSPVTDNFGNLWAVRRTDLLENVCEWSCLRRSELLRKDGEEWKVIAYVDDRCAEPYADTAIPEGLVFDAISGKLFLRLHNAAVKADCSPATGEALYEADDSLIAFAPFTKLVDALPSVEPLPACPDADADGWAKCDATCDPYGHACGDCDDSDPFTNPGPVGKIRERFIRDGKDNDCNGVIDH